MKPTSINPSLLTVTDVAEKLGTWLRYKRQRDEIEQALRQYERHLDLVLELVPESKQPLVFVEVDKGVFTLADYAKEKSGTSGTAEFHKDGAPKDADTFPGLLTSILQRAPNGLTHRQVMDKLLETQFAERVTRDEAKPYYNAMGRLFKRGTVVKHGDRVYHHKIFDVLKRKPGALQAERSDAKLGGSTQLILEILREHPEGLAPTDLRKMLVERDQTYRKQFEGTYIYNVIARLVRMGRIEKHEGKYLAIEMVKPRGNGASGPLASGEAR